MNKGPLKKILDHPDKDEIISKLIIDKTPKEINEWLKAKYTTSAEAKYILPERALKTFKDEYLDIYKDIKEDILKAKMDSEAELSIKNNRAYKQKLLQLVDKEIDIKQMLANMILAIETRAGEVFDSIQDTSNLRGDRVLIEWFNTLGTMLEKYHKIVNGAPDQVVQHNVTLQVVDKHILMFHDALKEVLSKMDVQTSLYFMEVFNEKMSKLKESENLLPEKPLTIEQRFEEVSILNKQISEKINES